MKLVLHPAARSADHSPPPQSLEGSSFSIGRGSDQDIAIADIRVPLQRARIVMRREQPWIESLTPDPLWIDGHALLEAPLSAGGLIELGRFSLEVSELLQDGLVLVVRERYGAQEDTRQVAQRFALGLRDLRLPVRAASWLLSLLVLVGGLGWPLWHVTGLGVTLSLDRAPASAQRAPLEAAPPGVTSGPPQDRLADFLSSGRLSAPHRHFADQCDQCHVAVFSRVDDTACLQCHATVDRHGKHVNTGMSGSVGPNCVDCHLEHQEDRRITLADARTCLNCHQQPQSDGLASVTHLRHAHPEFPVMAQSQGVVFPHAEHLKPEGIRGPDGDWTLDCNSCHLPNDTGGFQPLGFEAHCEGCHSIDLLAEAPGHASAPRARVPHAPLDEVRDFVQGHYSQLALREPPSSLEVRKPPGSHSLSSRRRASQAWAEAEAAREFDDLVGRRSCVICHELSPHPASSQTAQSQATAWSMSEPAIPRDYLPSTAFDHRSHQSGACTDCHQAESSGSASDWLMPDRTQCLGCHGGDDQRDDGIANCQTCHRFHNTGLDWAVGAGLGAVHP